MRIFADPAKNERNIRNRGLSFDSAAQFDFEGALYAVDERQDYGEMRYIAIGMLGVPLRVLCLLKPRTVFASSASEKLTHERSDDMPELKLLSDARGEVREITARDLKRFRPVRQALPGSLRRKVGVRGPQKSPTEERITIRLSQEAVQSFRATGEGWQTRVDAALQDWLRKRKSAA